MSAIGIRGLYKGKTSAQWSPVPGTVVEVEIEERRRLDRAAYPPVEFMISLHYKYVVNGRLYRGTRHLGGPVTSRANAVDLGGGHFSGQHIKVYVDERNPRRHTLYPGEYRQFWWLVAFGFSWLGFALWWTLR